MALGCLRVAGLLAPLCEGCPFPSWASRGPVHRAMSYEPFSRMAGAAPLASRGSAAGDVELALAALLLSAGR
jgi:hypothetical protein